MDQHDENYWLRQHDRKQLLGWLLEMGEYVQKIEKRLNELAKATYKHVKETNGHN